LPVCLHCGRLLWLEMNGKHVTVSFSNNCMKWFTYICVDTHTHTPKNYWIIGNMRLQVQVVPQLVSKILTYMNKDLI
jgi:hypothetical protein